MEIKIKMNNLTQKSKNKNNMSLKIKSVISKYVFLKERKTKTLVKS